jgi:hypothetical protein
MKSLCAAMALAVLFAGCASSSPPQAGQAQTGAYQPSYQSIYQPTYQPNYAANPAYAAPPGDTASVPPRLTVGTSYPDTQLILPWFLNDIINFVNYR